MIEIKTTHYITCDDVEELTGKRWDEFEFAQMAENDAYQILNCSDWYLEELYEDLEREFGNEKFENKEESEWQHRHCRSTRLKNQIELIEILRKDYGIRDSILIWISW
jgi:hypothetical protein